MRQSKQYIFLVIVVFVFFGSLHLWNKKQTHCRLLDSLGGPACSSQAFSLATRIRHNVAFASAFGPHFDVYLAVAWSIKRVAKGDVNVQVYAAQPFGYDFQTIVDEVGMYSGSVKDPSDFLPDIAASTAIDMVVIGTCEFDLARFQDTLLEVWDARDNDHKFKIACVVHNKRDDYWHHLIIPWARRNSIRLLPLSEHVAHSFRTKFKDLAGSNDPIIRSAGYELIPVDAHIPILDLQRFSDRPRNRILSNVVIQGMFDWGRRSYGDIFMNLNQSLHESPASWGYLPLGDGPSYVPDTSLVDPPFTLSLVGSGHIDIPTELTNIVSTRVGLNYSDFYEVMARMDLCIPAFSQSDLYYVAQASSSVAMCTQVNTPMLVTQRFRKAYTYLDDDRVAITYPAVMTEMDAIRALRTGDALSFLNSDPSGLGITMGSNAAVRRAVEEMMVNGWVRGNRAFADRKRKIFAENDAVALKLLYDLP